MQRWGRAIARLRVAEYESARNDIQAAIIAEREEGFISPIDLDALLNAIKEENRDYKIAYKTDPEVRD